MTNRENQIADLVTRKFGVMTAMLLCFVARQGKHDWNIDTVFSAWRRKKPSRSTFTNIINDMESVGWVDKIPGEKKSEVYLKIHVEKMVVEIGLKIDFGSSATDNCWLFTRDFFDGQEFFRDRVFKPKD